MTTAKPFVAIKNNQPPNEISISITGTAAGVRRFGPAAASSRLISRNSLASICCDASSVTAARRSDAPHIGDRKTPRYYK